ncbi:hypothetical protein RFI_29592, partial [Reticulomyxa filosa]
ARIYSIIGVCGGMGRFFGNACGGWLSHVNVYGSVWSDFPYVLPCLISGGAFLISLLVVTTLVKETSKQHQQKQDSTMAASAAAAAALTGNGEGRRSVPQKKATCDVIKIKNVWVITLFYGYASFLATGLQAVIPLWVLEEKKHNGFGWKESEIGTVFAIAGPCYTISQLVLFPKVMVATCVFVMINNADTPWFFFFFYARATANGIGQTFGSIGRLLAPAILCNIYAYCVDNNFSWPFNYCFVFYLQGFLSFFNATWLHFLLPKDYEKRCENNANETASSDAKSKSAASLQNVHNARTRSHEINYSDNGDYDNESGAQSTEYNQIELEEINTKN